MHLTITYIWFRDIKTSRYWMFSAYIIKCRQLILSPKWKHLT